MQEAEHSKNRITLASSVHLRQRVRTIFAAKIGQIAPGATQPVEKGEVPERSGGRAPLAQP